MTIETAEGQRFPYKFVHTLVVTGALVLLFTLFRLPLAQLSFPLLLLAQQDLISEIQVHGNRSVPADVVKAHIFTHPGDVYDPAAIERALGIALRERTQ